MATVLGVTMAYAWAGFRAVPFHGDEADHLYKSIDFNVAFVQARPQDLRVQLPVQPDSTEHIRLLTGNVHATLTGYALWSIEVQPQDWPQAWYYPQSVRWNITEGHWPEDRILERGRVPHVLLVVLSVPLAFVLVWRLQPPFPHWTALTAAVLLGWHPVWLLSGRRVMQESVLVVLSLVLVLLTMQLAARWRYWSLPLLALLSGLCVAAKPTGAITVLAVFLGLFVVLWQASSTRQQRLYRTAALGVCGVGSVVVYVLLTPAIWGNPPDMMRFMITERQVILEGQTAASEHAYNTPAQQAFALIEQPFLVPLQYYETPAFEYAIHRDIVNYEARGYAGWPHSQASEWVWTGLAGLGLVHLWRRRAEPGALIMLSWVLITGVVIGVSTTLAWQRYYLLWTVAVTLIAAVGLGTFCRWLIGWKFSSA